MKFICDCGNELKFKVYNEDKVKYSTNNGAPAYPEGTFTMRSCHDDVLGIYPTMTYIKCNKCNKTINFNIE